MCSTEEFSSKEERADKNMGHFDIYKKRHNEYDNNEQKESRKKPRFSPITHTDQPSPSAVHEKEWAEPKGEQSAHIDVPKERTSTTELDQRLLTKTDGLTLSQKEKLFKTALQSSGQEVLDELGKVIFTKNDYNYYQYCKDQIVAVLHEECNGEEFLGHLQKIPFFKDLYAMSVGVWEGYNLGDHTSMVLGQFRKYQMENWNSSLLTAKEFQLMLAIHDIGKPQAVQETGKTSKQYEYNGRIVPEFVRWLGIPEKKSKLMVALTMQDHLGGFLKDVSRSNNVSEKEENAKTVAEKISAEAAKIGVGVEQYFDLITRYYRADAGSYTVDAGGKQSLDFLFEKETAPNCIRKFAKRTQENYDILAEQVNLIASSKESEFKRKDKRNKNQSLKLDDVMNWKNQKIDAYRELDTLLKRSGQGTLEVSKSKTGEKFKIPSEYINKLTKGTLRYFIPEEKKQFIDQQREEKVEAVRGFITHYKNIQIVTSAIEVNSPNEWVDSEKHSAKEKELIEELQAKMQAVYRSLEGLNHLFSDNNHQAPVSREEKVTSFVTKELAKLKEMKQAMDAIDQRSRVGHRGKRALETMNKCSEHTEQMSDYPHTLGALEHSLNDMARKLYALTEIMAKKELDKVNKLISEVKNWDDEPIIKDIVTHQGYAQDVRQCFERLRNQREKCLALTTRQHDKKAGEQLLTALKDFIGHYDEALFVKQVIELAKDLTGRHDGVLLGKRVIELAKDLTDHPDKGIMKQVVEGLGKAMKMSLEVKNHGWDESTLADMVEDYWYAGYASKCIDNLNTRLEECLDLFKGKNTPEELLIAQRDLTDLRKEVKTVKRVRELAQARKRFAQTRDLEAARRLRKVLKKFKPSQLLLENYRKRLTDKWIRISIEEVDDKLICESVDKILNSKKINKDSTSENTDGQSNMINDADNSINNLVVFEEHDTKVYFRQLREKWSKKEWFSKLNQRQILENGQIKEIMKEYYESYMKAVDQKVQDVVQEGDPQMWIRCQPETLIRILQCGRFKSLFETGATGGNKEMNDRNRADTEHAYAGMPHNLPARWRLIFGYATANPSGEGSRSLERFGPVAVRLKSDLKEFALQVLGDSGLSDAIFCRSTFFDTADRHCLPLGNYIGSRILKIQGREDLEKAISWHEVQIPSVYVEDIEEVIFHKRIDDDQWLKAHLTKQLEQNSIYYRNSPFFQKEDVFQAAIRPDYQQVLDISGKEIFTEDEYCQYQQYREGIVTAMGKEDDVLMGSLQKIPFFEDLYGMQVGDTEGYTLKEHTSMMLEQFRKYQMKNWTSSFLSKGEFQLMLAIHKIEKTRAIHEIERTKNSLNTGIDPVKNSIIIDEFEHRIQKKHKGRIIPGLLEWLGTPEEKRKLMVALTQQDHLRSFLRYSNSKLTEWERGQVKKIAKEISAEATKIGIGVEEYFDLITCYYRAEAGSYTTDAGCRFGFKNYLFEAETAPNQTRAFSKQTQEYYDLLAEAVKSIASN